MRRFLFAAALLMTLCCCTEDIDMSSRYVFEGKTITQYLESKEYYSEYLRLLGKVPLSAYSQTTLKQLLSAHAGQH